MLVKLSQRMMAILVMVVVVNGMAQPLCAVIIVSVVVSGSLLWKR
jgi:hypothetical protein